MNLLTKLFLVVIILFLGHSGSAQVWQELFGRADSLNSNGQVNLAYTVSQQAEKQAEIEFGKEHYHTAQSMLMVGSLLNQQGDYVSAEKKLTATRNLLNRVAPTSTERVEVANYLGLVYRNQARYTKADSAIQEALQVALVLSPINQKKYRAYTLSNLASLYRVKRETRRAEPLLLEALALQDSLTGKVNLEYASYLSSLASVYSTLQEYTRAEPLYLEALTIYRQLLGDEHPRVALVMSNLAIQYIDFGDYNKALVFFLKALSIRDKTGSKGRDYVLNLENIAVCYSHLNQLSLADSLYVRVLTMLEKQVGKTNPSYANTLQNRAATYLQTGRYVEACEQFDIALRLARPAIGTENELYARLLSNAAAGYMALGNLAKADSLNTTALAIAERILGKNAVAFAAYLFVQGQIKYNSQYLKDGSDLMEKALNLLEGNFNRSFLIMTPYQKEAFVSKWTGLYQRYFSILINSPSSGRTYAHPYNIILSLKNMLLNEHSQLVSVLDRSTDTRLKNRLDSLRKVKDLIANLYTKPLRQRQNIDSLETLGETLEKQLASQSATFRRAQQSLQIHWEDVRNALKPNEAAVEFVSFPHNNGVQKIDSVRYMALVLRPGDKAPQLVPLLTDEAPLRRLLARKTGASTGAGLYATRGSEIDTDQLTRGDSLYQLIWQPIDRLLAGVKTVYLAPSGLLHQVSFAALPYRDSRKKNVRYLADRYQLRQVGSTRQVVTQTYQADTYQSLTSVRLYGGIQYDTLRAPLTASSSTRLPTTSSSLRLPGSWPYLPGTQTEVEQISQLIGPKATVVKGTAATETALKNLSGQSPGVLHIATHGFAFPDPTGFPNDSSAGRSGAMFRRIANPLLRTGLLMAGSNRAWQGERPALGEDDGILTAYEVASLNLSTTKLVVLSACETALGDIRGSEGVFGLQRAFKMAGAGYLLMSLWPVADQATSDLMTQFYREWKKHKLIRKAFEQTQLHLRKKYPPSVWAAFVLIE